VSGVPDEQGQTPERGPHHLRVLFLQMVGDVCLSFKGAEGLAEVEELNEANVREANRFVYFVILLNFVLYPISRTVGNE